jgi:hypothetical protein
MCVLMMTYKAHSNVIQQVLGVIAVDEYCNHRLFIAIHMLQVWGHCRLTIIAANSSDCNHVTKTPSVRRSTYRTQFSLHVLS